MAGKISFSKTFLKHFKKRITPSKKISNQFNNRILLFSQNPQHPLLKDHMLIGSKEGLRAFSVSGDIRVVYRIEIIGEYTLLDIGTHSQVY